MKKIINNIKVRNFTEWFACLIVVLLFSKSALSSQSFFSTLMNLEIIFAAIFVSLCLYNKSHKELKYLDLKKPESFKTFIKKQTQLLSKARYWYVIPFSIGVMGLSIEKMILNKNQQLIPELIYFISTILIGCLITYLNEVVAVNNINDEFKKINLI